MLGGRIAASATAALALLVGCSTGKDASPAADRSVAGEGARLTVRDQSGDGKQMVIPELRLGRPGYAVARQDADGAPGGVLGASPLLAAGDHRDVVVRLTPPLTAPSTVNVMVHMETNGNRSLDYPAADPPAKDGARVVTLPVRVGA